MLTEENQLLEQVSLGVDSMPLGFVISDDGRTLLAVTGRSVCTADACLLLPKHLPENCQNQSSGSHSGNGDGVIELVTTPVAFIQQSDAIVRPVIKINNATPIVNSVCTVYYLFFNISVWQDLYPLHLFVPARVSN